MSEAEFILKSTPPRVPRTAYRRDRLVQRWEMVRDRTAIVIVAPRGFGKTTLLAQWRRAWLEQGAMVAWLGVDEQDDPLRFTAGLLHALNGAAGRPLSSVAPVARGIAPDRMEDALTRLLAQVAALGSETVLVIDEAERLPEATVRQALTYLLRNAPANLHVLLASRVPLAVETWDLDAAGHLATIEAEELRLRQDEASEILLRRFGDRLSVDQRVRVHAATEGWPIALQLAAGAIEREADAERAIESLSGRSGNIARYFMESLLARLPAPLVDFLVQVSILEHLGIDLCEAVTKCGQSAEFLEQLLRETPVVAVGEAQDWYRLHPLARDFLLGRFEALPQEERDAMHCRAYHWFARQGRFHEAACHALAAGDEPAAHSHAARALWSLGTAGRLAEAGAWLARLPAGALEADAELELVAAWIMAFGERSEDALAIARRVLDDPASTPRLRVIASRVATAAAAFCDRVGLIPQMHPGVDDPLSVIDDPIYVLSFANTKALVDLHDGDTEAVRRGVDRAPPAGDHSSLPLAIAFSRILIGASYLWDGDAIRCEAVMRPALEEAERNGDRRGIAACMHAALLAAAVCDRGRVAEAEALLADRLDVIERTGIPEVLLYAYDTLVQAALERGDERRALDLLANLRLLAHKRHLPRLAMVGWAEQARIHAQGGRPQAAQAALVELDALAPALDAPDFLPFRPRYRLMRATVRVHVALGLRDLEEAEAQLAIAEAQAAQLHRGWDALNLKVLRAVIARQRHLADALPLLAEAMSLGALQGRDRLLADSHPLAARMHADLDDAAAAPPAARPVAPAPATAMPPALLRSGPLTPKEADVLRLLGSGLSNKGIARALEVSDETVKWHLKNLFLKLSAGTRKHAVDRARLLGLLGA